MREGWWCYDGVIVVYMMGVWWCRWWGDGGVDEGVMVV